MHGKLTEKRETNFFFVLGSYRSLACNTSDVYTELLIHSKFFWLHWFLFEKN